MKVKKFTAPTMPEAMKNIRAELGESAVILNSKIIYTGGFLGLFKKKYIEVIAAIDPNSNQTAREKRPAHIPAEIKEKPPLPAMKVPSEADIGNGSHELKKEITELQSIVRQLKTKDDFGHYPEAIRNLLLYLKDQDVDEKYIFEAAEHLSLLTQNKEVSSEELNSSLSDFLQLKLTGFEFGGISYHKKYVNVIGPTGVGKTTTLAKMASEAVLEERKKIAFITTDTYRIAAIEQLKTYAQLLNVPLEVVYKLEDFQKAIDKFSDYDVIFIDTAGRNFREEKYVKDLEKIIDFKNDMETFLVLSMTSKEKDLHEIIRNFSNIPIEKFIFSKVDETSSYGTMYNLLRNEETGAAYITSGQSVPEDISEASSKEIVELVMEGISK
ncbi:flagellar biosynthesis protein FlhF [Rossellomorea vietnamensis]|uniref:Flagellar biosynthesis protein FlhF n=1 Tax=Rossellomorea vietnamensis TaxID=218284 RepID=A0A5D4MDX0_9BACI|nr:flagellar biosynthesis protein FlhF [Rossellomorea vietnamensis]TYS00150.1 flagellar biosynthesis protein FlhF [Rossellomorea vietnamensis]